MKKKTIRKLKESFGKVKTEGFHFEWIESYFRNKDNSTSFHTLSDRTWQDLDFDELFMFLDRTHSRVGQQYLYNQLRNIPANSEQQQLREDTIHCFIEDADFRIEIQGQLEKLNKENAYYISSLFQEEHVKPPQWYFIIPLLSFTNLLSLILLPFNFQMLFVLLGVFVVNLGIHYWNKRNLNQYLGSIHKAENEKHVKELKMKSGSSHLGVKPFFNSAILLISLLCSMIMCFGRHC